MTDNEIPEVVAAANLSPVSPRPLHNTYTLPQVLPELQDQAENPDIVPLEPDTFRTAAAAMATQPDQEQTEPVSEVHIEGLSNSDAAAESDDSSIADNESIEYGDAEEGDGQEQEVTQPDAPQETPDDYARTFDSPGQEHSVGAEAESAEEQDQQPQQDSVLNAPESMNITEQPDQPDAVSAQSFPAQPAPVDAPAPSLAADGSQPNQARTPAQNATAPQPTENGGEPSPPVQGAMPDATIPKPSPDQQPATPPHPHKPEADVKPEETAATREREVDVLPQTEDVEMTTEDAPDATALDIQKLVDEITAKAEATDQPSAEPAMTQPAASSPLDVDMSSLPPKPALTQEQSKQTFSPATYHHASLPNAPNFPASAATPSQQPSFANGAAPGVSQPQNFNATPAFASYPNAYPPGSTSQQDAVHNGAGLQQTYDEFLADERKHMAEAKWERFPEGSRIFIGNLSQERVSKKDVFELFHQHGRLAQISLKSAYGFVQYHTVDDAQSAMNALQGAEVKGRKINLEISRTQKTKKDRDHSPSGEKRNRGERGGRNADRNGDRYDGRGGRRDDVRQGRSPSPRREDHRGRHDSYTRNRGHQDAYNRKRSRSPEPYQRQDAYRRRSPSPYGRGRQEPDQLDIPRRYGNDVPDVQILLMQEVHNDFVDWVQRGFWERGLKTNALFLNPRFPRDAVIQRQVLEGVHGVVELDMRAQNTAKIPLQVFDRSAGSNVRFDQYQDLDPPIAAQLVQRAKGSIAQQPAYPPQPQHAYPPQPYGTPAPYAAFQQPPPQQAQAATPDLTHLVGQLSQIPNVDSSTLQTILASLQQPAPSHAPAMGHPHHAPPPAAPHSQMDLNALISNISAASVNTGQPGLGGAGMPGYPAPPYHQGGNRGPPQPVAGSSDPARDVENIMATLARYRQ